MGTHSPAPKVAFAIHVDLVEARAVIPARLLPQLDLVAFGGGSLIEVLYFVADTMYTAVVGELEDVLLFVVREMATVFVRVPREAGRGLRQRRRPGAKESSSGDERHARVAYGNWRAGQRQEEGQSQEKKKGRAAKRVITVDCATL